MPPRPAPLAAGGRRRSLWDSTRPAVGILPPGQCGDLVEDVNLADDQAGLGVLVVLAAVVGDADVRLQPHQLLILRERAHVEGPPGQAAGQVGDLDRHLAVQGAGDVPESQVLHAGRKNQLRDVDLVGAGLRDHFQTRRVDQRILPRELQAVGAFLERQGPALAGQGHVRRIVDRQLHRVARGQRHEIHLRLHGGRQNQTDDNTVKSFHFRVPLIIASARRNLQRACRSNWSECTRRSSSNGGPIRA